MLEHIASVFLVLLVYHVAMVMLIVVACWWVGLGLCGMAVVFGAVGNGCVK